jgi:hypothetical protein
VLNSPTKVDELGALALSLDCAWNAERLFMIVTAYCDESGMEGPRAFMAGYVARVGAWHGFVRKWKKLLDDENIPYSHILEMRKGEHPFEGWDDRRIAKDFLPKANKIIRKYCTFGVTVAVDLDLHRNVYQANMPDRTPADSAYGLCSRSFFEIVPQMVERYMGLRHARINFVLERHDQHFGDAERIFHDLKKYDRMCSETLGTITPGDYNIAALQAADTLAFLARRFEPKVEFGEAPADITGLRKQSKITRECPIMHFAIVEGHIQFFHESSAGIARLTRRDAAIRKKERKALKPPPGCEESTAAAFGAIGDDVV